MNDDPSTYQHAVMVPLLMSCNAAPFSRRTPVLFRRDAAFAALVAALGLTNGYAGSLCMAHGPKTLPPRPAAEREAAAVTVNAAVVAGIATGSAMSYLVRGWL